MTNSKEITLQRNLLIDALSAIVDITAATNNKKQDVKKQIIHSSPTRIVHLSLIKEGSTSTVENAPFDADLMLIEGVVDITDSDGGRELISNSEQRYRIKKGLTSKGLALEDSAIITSIKLDT